MAEKYAEEEEKGVIFVSSEIYKRVQQLCEKKDLGPDDLVGKALDAFESS